MILDNKKFSEEQKQIITSIGKKYKDNKEKHLRKVNVIALITILIFMSILTFLYLLDSRRISTITFLILFGSGVGIFNYSKAKKKLLKVLSGDDYEVGLYYANKDDEVIGNGYKMFKQTRVGFIALGILGLVVTIPMGLISYNESPVDYNSLTEITGILEEGYFDADDGIQMRLEGDDTVYRIQSIYTVVLDIDRIFDEVDLGDEVIYRIGEVKVVNGDTLRDVYYYEADSVEYMNYDLMMQGYNRNHNLGIVVVIVFGLLGVGSIISFFVYKNYILIMKQEKEKFDLSIKNKVIEFDRDEDLFELTSKPKIATYAPRWMIIFMIIMIVGFFIGMILSLIYITDPFNRVGIPILCGVLALLCVVGCYDGLRNNEMIDGDYFISHRFFKTKKFHIKEISRLSVTGGIATLLDSNNKTLVNISTFTKNLDKIIDRLNEFGVLVETDMG